MADGPFNQGNHPTPCPTFTVATAIAPAADPTRRAGDLIYVSNGAAGSPILAFSDGTNWKRSDTGATIS